MNRELFDKYLHDYIRDALIYSDKNVDEAANYLLSQKTRRFFAKQEQKEALARVQKNFSAYRDRPLWFVLKCMGYTLEDFEDI
jgi:hypothetical protein